MSIPLIPTIKFARGKIFKSGLLPRLKKLKCKHTQFLHQGSPIILKFSRILGLYYGGPICEQIAKG